MKTKATKKNKKIPQITKNIKDFLLNEDGKISKKNIAAIGTSLALLDIVCQKASATYSICGVHSHSILNPHSNNFIYTDTGGHNSAQSTSVALPQYCDHSDHNNGGHSENSCIGAFPHGSGHSAHVVPSQCPDPPPDPAHSHSIA